MQFDEILKKTEYTESNKPNLKDYENAYNSFDWNNNGYSRLEWLKDGGLNNAYESIDKHVAKGFGDKLSMIWIGKNGEEEKYTYADFKEESDKFAQVMVNLGMEKGDRVFIFMDRIPELYFAAMIEPSEDQETIYLYGYINSDKKSDKSEKFKFNNTYYYSLNDGIVYFDDGKTSCQADAKKGICLVT